MDSPPPPPPSEDLSQGSPEDSSQGPLGPGPSATVEWRLASPDGSQQFGPTVPTVFAQWIAEGRVQPDWLVWRSDWGEWKTAAEAAADLPVPLIPPVSPPLSSPTPPPQAPTETAPTETAPPSIPSGASYTARRRRSKRQRRTLALVLGVITLVLLGLLVWLVVG